MSAPHAVSGPHSVSAPHAVSERLHVASIHPEYASTTHATGVLVGRDGRVPPANVAAAEPSPAVQAALLALVRQRQQLEALRVQSREVRRRVAGERSELIALMERRRAGEVNHREALLRARLVERPHAQHRKPTLAMAYEAVRRELGSEAAGAVRALVRARRKRVADVAQGAARPGVVLVPVQDARKERKDAGQRRAARLAAAADLSAVGPAVRGASDVAGLVEGMP